MQSTSGHVKHLNANCDLMIAHDAQTSHVQETSGHAEHYRENMFQIEVEKQLFGLKPMNCPGKIVCVCLFVCVFNYLGRSPLISKVSVCVCVCGCSTVRAEADELPRQDCVCVCASLCVCLTIWAEAH